MAFIFKCFHWITNHPFEFIFYLILLLYGFAFIFSGRPAGPTTFIPKSLNKVYHSPVTWKGIPIDRKKRFLNFDHPFYQNYVDILNWLPGHIVNLIRNYDFILPVTEIKSSDFLTGKDVLIWLGHASFFLRINGTNILIDPIFYKPWPYKRHSDNRIHPNLFRDISYVLISHNHADHCDKKSLELLYSNNPDLTFLSGLGMESVLNKFSLNRNNIITAEWYEEYPLQIKDVAFIFVPSRHYCKRLFKPFNKSLWGGFIIKYKDGSEKNKTIYFEGDSGYGSHFKDIGILFKPDIAILGIGAHKPAWLMKPNHISPDYAITAFEDTGASLMVPMHYGTFNLSNEKMKEPIQVLKNNLHFGKLEILKPGDQLPV